MVRRTKDEALATRDSILDAAERLFEEQGVSRTSLQHIATAAGVTRGAIYWHFRDKADLFDAMMKRATMPLESTLEAADETAEENPVADVRECLLAAFRLTATDTKARRVFDIATHKIEYVAELTGVRDRRLATHNEWLQRAEQRLQTAIQRGLLKSEVPARVTALGLLATAIGLIQLWLLNPKAFDLIQVGTQTVDSVLNALKAD
jgi:TetR/AcrR family acrAB operon transcriptional repressor